MWTTANPRLLAKIYHHPTNQRQHKLTTMIDHPPKMPLSSQSFIPYAWPKSLLINDAPRSRSLQDHQIVGFLMPRITGGRELIDLYNPSRRKRLGIKINWHFLHVAAHNIASIIETLHNQGIILGDIKPQNILINNQALPAIIDTDSFQVKNPATGSIYRCLVGSDGFTPPELLGLDFSLITQTHLHDRFRLGVIIYYLLFGSHPFQGQWSGQGDPPEQHELIRQGHWVFSPGSLLKPSHLTIPLNIVHPALQLCFWRCFQDGHRNPSQRPSAQEWQQVLAEASTELKQCSAVKSHLYSAQESSCYWCDRQARLKTDIFDHTIVPPQPPKPVPPFLPPVIPVPPLPAKNPVPSHLLFVPVKRGNTYGFQLAFLPNLLFVLTGVAITASIIQVAVWITQPSFRYPRPITQAPRLVPGNPAPSRPPRPRPLPTPETAENLLRAGYSSYIQSDYVQALQDLTRALAINPNFAEAYYYRSLVKQTLGYSQEAKWDWHLAQRLAPDKMPFNPMFTSLDLALPLDGLGRTRSLPPNEVLPVNVLPGQALPPSPKPLPPSPKPLPPSPKPLPPSPKPLPSSPKPLPSSPKPLPSSPKPLPPSPKPLPSLPIQSPADRFLELQIEQINQDILRLKSEINQEPNTIPLPKTGDLPQP